MPKELQVENIRRYIREHTDIDQAEVDVEAEVDSSLHFDENWERIKDELGIKTETEIMEDIKEWKEKIHKKRTEQFKKEFRETLEKVKEEGKAVGKYYKELRGYVRALIHSDQDSLVIYSKAGYGKSYQVQATLKEEGLEYGRDYEVKTGYSTPMELYHTLYENRDNVLILDDVEGIAHDQKALSLLKACTWSVGENRTLTYSTTSSKLEAPKTFEFKGKIIICLNRSVEGDPDFEALKSRSIYHELELTYQELVNGIFPKIAKNKMEEEKAEEVVGFIRKNSNPACNLEIRDLIKAISLYEYAENEGVDWKPLVDGLIDSNPDLDLVWRLMKDSSKSVKEKIRKFKEETGKSRKTYYNYKNELESMVEDV